MAWKVEYVRTAEKQLGRLDKVWQRRILDYLDHEIAALDDPRVRGKPLSGELAGFWRYRVGDYRVICQVAETIHVITVYRIGHRRSVYQ
ncbi:MAG: type II toxin-antitoxin system RelE/ParE family toxin [Thermomicrobiales bacterium]|nr:type II toxin-antitoxin system RelE/ParE family toxin [Thermomicrobiales bacterium]